MRGAWRGGGAGTALAPVTMFRQGVRINARQIAVLVALNAIVGGMVGLERSTLPLLGPRDFGLTTATAALSFIVSFGFAKAVMNLLAGRLADLYGRRLLLVAGWLVGLPAPLLVIAAPHWGWVLFANVLLGVNQALCWSMTVVMKVDLAGPRRRGLVLGLNEFAGYGGVAVASLAAGYLAATTALRPYPFLIGVGLALVGLAVTLLLVGETRGYAHAPDAVASEARVGGRLAEVFATVSWRNRRLFAFSQGGLVTNLNDGMAWGLFPLYFSARGLDLRAIAGIVAVYPAVWAVGQLVTGPLSDRVGRRPLLASGMFVQALAIVAVLWGADVWAWVLAAAGLGLGTAMVYPVYLAAVADVAEPRWRAAALGVYRFWRDLGYALGALLTGLIVDASGAPAALVVVAAVVLVSGVIVALLGGETLSPRSQHRPSSG